MQISLHSNILFASSSLSICQCPIFLTGRPNKLGFLTWAVRDAQGQSYIYIYIFIYSHDLHSICLIKCKFDRFEFGELKFDKNAWNKSKNVLSPNGALKLLNSMGSQFGKYDGKKQIQVNQQMVPPIQRFATHGGLV